MVHATLTRFLLKQAGLKSSEADSGAVTLIQRFGSAANLNIHLHCLVLDGVYRRTGEGPVFVATPAPSDEAIREVLHKIISGVLKMLVRQGTLIEDQGSADLADIDTDGEDARTLVPLQAAATTYRIAFGPRAGQKILTLQRAMPHEAPSGQALCANAHGFSLHAAVRCDTHQFLQSRELRRTMVPSNFPQAELLLERATALDPDFAPAYAELAFLQHYYIGVHSSTRSRAEKLERGLLMARRAYELAPDLPFVSHVLGALHMWARDFAEAERWSRRAIRLGPGDAENYVGLANVLSFAGRSEEAIELMHTANRYNPIRPPMHEFNLARALAWTGRFEQALPVAQSCKRRAPGFWPCTMVLAVTLAHLGRITEAAAALAEWRQQCAAEAPQEYLDRVHKLPGPELDRLRDGLRLAGLADG